MTADAIVVRPACLVATVVGSAAFVVALPAALFSKSVKKTANTLVVKPAKATFTRPVGDMEDLNGLTAARRRATARRPRRLPAGIGWTQELYDH